MQQDQQKIESFSALMAEVMGWNTSNYKTFIYKGCVRHVKDMRYHSSFDWLHPVWCRFRDMENDLIDINELFQHDDMCREIVRLFMHSDTPYPAFIALGEALEWVKTVKKEKQ